MTRVERTGENPRDNSEYETHPQQPREFIDRKPSQAEGDEKTVDEALENQDEKRRT